MCSSFQCLTPRTLQLVVDESLRSHDFLHVLLLLWIREWGEKVQERMSRELSLRAGHQSAVEALVWLMKDELIVELMDHWLQVD